MKRRSGSPPTTPAPGLVRIIGGDWRGTRLPVTDRPGLRPTADRVRETLFNWLQPMIHQARVIDLFAGSGALGLEAVSRGAREAVLIERDPALADNLRRVAAKLPGGERVQVVCADALTWLRESSPGSDHAFDLAFVDPPFASALWRPALDALRTHLGPEAWLYVESPPDADADPDETWAPHREGRTRDVRYALYRRHTPPHV